MTEPEGRSGPCGKAGRGWEWISPAREVYLVAEACTHEAGHDGGCAFAPVAGGRKLVRYWSDEKETWVEI